MSSRPEDFQRLVIPRWRDYKRTLESGELAPASRKPAPPPTNNGQTEDHLASRISDWQDNRTLPFAADLVAAAYSLGRGEEATEAARFILEQGDEAPEAIRLLAGKVAGLTSATSQDSEIQSLEVTTPQPVMRIEEVRKLIGETRRKLVEYPRNPLLWGDLALHYASWGQNEQARRAIRAALTLSPNNRFLLRSAARLYTHLNEAEQAHDLLRNKEVTRHDPWLLASEIAVADLAGRTSRFIKVGRELAESRRYSPMSTSELCSALGSLEFMSGAAKQGKKLLRQSLIDPNDNAIAQAMFMSRQMNGLELKPELFNKPFAFEAKAWEFYGRNSWEEALIWSHYWLNDEPFASQPAVFGSFIALTMVEDYQLSMRLTGQALRANPADPVLLNNHTVALANLGRINEAETTFRRIRTGEAEPGDVVAIRATEGLLRFRRGDSDGGRQLYVDAIKLATERKDHWRYVLAWLHLAREEILARTNQSEFAFQCALEESKRYPDPGLTTMRERLTALRHQATSDLNRPGQFTVTWPTYTANQPIVWPSRSGQLGTENTKHRKG